MGTTGASKKSIASYLYARRQALGLTQKDLADAAGYSIQAISRFENGETSLSIASLPTIANLLKVSLDDIFFRKEPSSDFTPLAKFDDAAMAVTLKSLRQKAGYSQSEEAALLQVSPKTVFNYEVGATLPSLDATERLLEVYHLSAQDFFYPPKPVAPLPTKPAPAKGKKHVSFPRVMFILLAVVVLGGAATGFTVAFGPWRANEGGSSSYGNANTSSRPTPEPAPTSSKPTAEKSFGDMSVPFSSYPSVSSPLTTSRVDSRPDISENFPGLKNLCYEINGQNTVTLVPGVYLAKLVVDVSPSDIQYPSPRYTIQYGSNSTDYANVTMEYVSGEIYQDVRLTIGNGAYDKYHFRIYATLQDTHTQNMVTGRMLDVTISNPSNP